MVSSCHGYLDHDVRANIIIPLLSVLFLDCHYFLSKSFAKVLFGAVFWQSYLILVCDAGHRKYDMVTRNYIEVIVVARYARQ